MFLYSCWFSLYSCLCFSSWRCFQLFSTRCACCYPLFWPCFLIVPTYSVSLFWLHRIVFRGVWTWSCRVIWSCLLHVWFFGCLAYARLCVALMVYWISQLWALLYFRLLYFFSRVCCWFLSSIISSYAFSQPLSHYRWKIFLFFPNSSSLPSTFCFSFFFL